MVKCRYPTERHGVEPATGNGPWTRADRPGSAVVAECRRLPMETASIPAHEPVTGERTPGVRSAGCLNVREDRVTPP